jgi:hypothetical protein
MPAMVPPTSADRSRPPTPMAWLTPSPHWSRRHMTSWAPVPAAATTPTRPARTALAKPSPAPPSMAVPAPGPMTSRPSEAPRCFRSTSSPSPTLSLNSRTCRPCDRALWASSAAKGPGTETMATLASWRVATASSMVLGTSVASGPPGSCWAAAEARVPSPASMPAAAWGAVPARTARTRSFARTAGTSNPAAARSSTLAGVPMTAAAHSTPGAPDMARVAAMRSTEST